MHKVFAQSVPATALKFDGVIDYVLVNNTLGNFGTGDFNIEMKVKTASSAIMYLVSKRNFCDNQNFFSMRNTGKCNFL